MYLKFRRLNCFFFIQFKYKLSLLKLVNYYAYINVWTKAKRKIIKCHPAKLRKQA